jgi:hypothetical protein
MTSQRCKTAYKEIAGFPIPTEPIRYVSGPNGDYRYKTSFHDIIHANLIALVPNIEMGYYKGHTTEEIEDWIKNTKTYAFSIYQNIKRRCEFQARKLEYMKQHAERSKELDTEKLQTLPEDIIRYIYGFILPETRITLYLARYPTYAATLKRLTSTNLKKYLHHINNTYMMNSVFEYNPDRRSCIANTPTFYVSFSKKSDGVKQLTDLFNVLRNPIPKKQECVRYFENHALKLLMSMIYVSNYKPSLRKNPKRPKPTEEQT